MNKRLGKFLAAVVLYTVFAVYLYQPYFKIFSKVQLLVVFNSIAGALGCYVLSRRWVADFGSSLFAGAIYGFGPFLLSLGKFHPTAGFLAAVIPWLFCPATFGPRGKWRWLRVPLSVLPFAAIILFFQVAGHFRLFAIPVQANLGLTKLVGILAPMVMVKRCIIAVGFYHVPLAALLIDFSMLFAARRFGVIIILSAGMILSFCNPFFGISPIIWLALPVVCCCVGIGEGVQGLIFSSRADRKWLLTSVMTMCALAVVMLLFAVKYHQVFARLGDGYAGIFADTAKMYILGAAAMAIVFFMAIARLRVHWVRVALLYSSLAVDIFLGASFIVDSIF